MNEKMMFRPHVLRRLAYLRNLEFLNIFLLPLALAMVLSSRDVQEWQPYEDWPAS